jgi:membrane associated rhomboid family serine protease
MGVAVVGMKQSGVNPFQTGLGITLLINLLITFTIPGISIGGHLGGLIGGAACGFFLFGAGRTQMPDWIRIAGPTAVGIVAFLIAYGSI